MSHVMMVTFVSPRRAHSASMCSFCVAELDTPVILARGYFSAIQSVSEPQPQPSSRISCPSVIRARSQVSASMTSSASASVSRPVG